MEELRQEAQRQIEMNWAQQVQALQSLISIESVREDPVTTRDGAVYPFGQGVQDAFACALELGEALGFTVKDVDHYGGHIDFGTGEETVGVLGHLDVVPAGTGWTFDPFSGAVDDGWIYGRGASDDKGPVVAVLFAMKALRDAGYVPARKIRLILGLDEETAWEGMDYYFAHEPKPSYGFTPDAEFPALNGEKGIVTYELAKKFAPSQNGGLVLRKLDGGSAANMVAEHARAVVYAEHPEIYGTIREKAAAYRERTGYRLNTKGVGKSLEISAVGKAAHGATPEAGRNAISILLMFLAELSFANDDVNVFLDFYRRCIGFDTDGSGMGCAMEDAPSGKLTLNAGLIRCNGQAVTLTVNLRYPVTCTEEEIYARMLKQVDAYDMGIIRGHAKAPIYMDPDSPMIRTLVDIYQRHTGDRESRPQVIGGGTYARAAEHVVAFGALFPGDADTMHQKDERLSLARFRQMTQIYTDALWALTQPDFHWEEQA